MHGYILVAILFLTTVSMGARTLHVGASHPYANPAAAVLDAAPGDTILIHEGTYNSTYFIEELQGNAQAWIVIRAADGEAPVFSGASESMHFSDCAYLRIEGLIIQGQTGNGMNIDDAGTIETPSHHIILSNMTFRDMAATGNNDLLKLSGLDTFAILNCTFLNGATGGSGIDMVGCHAGVIERNTFTNMGSNAIQAKGGTAFIRILRNVFTDAGERAVNLGGSTGLQFFRPLDAPYEAADMQVFSNIFVRGTAAIAYVGSTRIDVANNTIINPVRWVMRILQETVDTTRFVKCGNNLFRNNIVLTNGLAGPHVNIGSNTAPETFGFQTNLWYDQSNPANSTPTLPTTELGGIRGQDPRLVNTTSAPLDLHVMVGSPAIGAGSVLTVVDSDYDYRPYRTPPTIGAFEYVSPVSVANASPDRGITIAPNPASDVIRITGSVGITRITDLLGNEMAPSGFNNSTYSSADGGAGSSTDTRVVNIGHWPSGIYLVNDGKSSALLVVSR